jgi:hypothetical protein
MESGRALDKGYLRSIAVEHVHPDDIGRQCPRRKLLDDRMFAGNAGVNIQHGASSVNESSDAECNAAVDKATILHGSIEGLGRERPMKRKLRLDEVSVPRSNLIAETWGRLDFTKHNPGLSYFAGRDRRFKSRARNHREFLVRVGI